MNKSQQIYFDKTKAGTDMYTKVRLEQDVDTLEFMSMSLTTEEIYRDFNSDYGVLVGRVTANGGVGIPNAKISIFIPLADEDDSNGDITSIYPYKTPRDKNNEGKRYNLLPRVSKIDPKTGLWSPKQPFGSFPIKEEIVTNSNILNVYKKYYKYTALTNNAGDYMIFGVPIGIQTVHLSVDITDIGKYSMNPAAMVTNLGYSPNLFKNNNSMIKESTDLNDLPNIETQEISVDVIPFWGDATNFEIGITRQDFRIRAVLVNTFILFGSVFTDGVGQKWGNDDTNGTHIYELFYAGTPAESMVSIATKRTAKVTEKIYYYPTEISDFEIDNDLASADPQNMVLLSPSEYSIYKRDGDFVFIVNCNRNKITTDELGNDIRVSDSSPNGVFTEFRGFVTLEITPEDAPMISDSDIGGIGTKTKLTPYRYKYKFPQYAERNHTFTYPNNPYVIDDYTDTQKWRKEHHIFSAGTFYSFSKFHGITMNKTNDDVNQHTIVGFFNNDIINKIPNDADLFYNVGAIATTNIGEYSNELYKFPNNGINNTTGVFGGNWLNLSIHMPQAAYVYDGYANISFIRTADNFSSQIKENSDIGYNDYYMTDNLQEIAAYDSNTKGFARSDLHWTDIIKVPVTDLKKMITKDKGFVDNPTTGATFSVGYRNGKYLPSAEWVTPCPLNGGKINGDSSLIDADPNRDPATYFYKGFGNSDCIKFLVDLGLIN